MSNDFPVVGYVIALEAPASDSALDSTPTPPRIFGDTKPLKPFDAVVIVDGAEKGRMAHVLEVYPSSGTVRVEYPLRQSSITLFVKLTVPRAILRSWATVEQDRRTHPCSVGDTVLTIYPGEYGKVVLVTDVRPDGELYVQFPDLHGDVLLSNNVIPASCSDRDDTLTTISAPTQRASYRATVLVEGRSMFVRADASAFALLHIGNPVQLTFLVDGTLEFFGPAPRQSTGVLATALKSLGGDRTMVELPHSKERRIVIDVWNPSGIEQSRVLLDPSCSMILEYLPPTQ